LQRRLLNNYQSGADDEEDKVSQLPNGLRGLYSRQQSSQQQHIERIRGRSPSTNKNEREEVMRLKNELAMQRLLRLQKVKAAAQQERRQSVANEYTPMRKCEPSQNSPLSDAPLPSERNLRHRRYQPIIELPKVPTSARNVVSLEALQQIKQLAI
jgi:hypothetical protein